MRDDADDSRDLLSDRLATAVIYWLPIAVLIVSGFFAVPNVWRAAIWAAALLTMGVGCILNALRCGRVHCYATGPFFLLMAAVAVLYGVGVLRPGSRGWNTIGLITLGGGVALYCLPELLLGRYRPRGE